MSKPNREQSALRRSKRNARRCPEVPDVLASNDVAPFGVVEVRDQPSAQVVGSEHRVDVTVVGFCSQRPGESGTERRLAAGVRSPDAREKTSIEVHCAMRIGVEDVDHETDELHQRPGRDQHPHRPSGLEGVLHVGGGDVAVLVVDEEGATSLSFDGNDVVTVLGAEVQGVTHTDPVDDEFRPAV